MPALVVTVMSCLLPPKSSTRAALPSGSGRDCPRFLHDHIAVVGGILRRGWVRPLSKGGHGKAHHQHQGSAEGRKDFENLLFFMVGISRFVVIGGSSGHTGNRAAREHGGKLLRVRRSARTVWMISRFSASVFCASRVFSLSWYSVIFSRTLAISWSMRWICSSHFNHSFLKNQPYQFIRP